MGVIRITYSHLTEKEFCLLYKALVRQHLCKKANRIMGVIRRTYSHLTEKEFCLLYKALVRPHIESNNVIWAPRYKKDVELLEQVQNRATKQVLGLRDMEYSDRLKHLKLPTLVFHRIRGDMIEIYKIINVYDPKVASQLIQLYTNKSTRGQSIKIRRDHANRDIRRNYLMQRAATMWNYLPEAVVTAKTTNIFKNRLNKYWKNHPLRWEYTANHDYSIKNITYNIEHATNEPEPEEKFKEELVIEA